MRFPIYVIDAFATQRFKGNPAAVLISQKELECSLLQSVAAEFNLSETAFPVPLNQDETFDSARVFNLRFFSPKKEVDLCGHATLSTAHVLFNEYGNYHKELEFRTKGGVVTVRKQEKRVEMNFPAHSIKCANIEGIDNARRDIFEELTTPAFLMELIRCVVLAEIDIRSVVLSAELRHLIIEIDEATTQEQFLSLKPDLTEMMRLHPTGELIEFVTVTLAPHDSASQGFKNDEEKNYDYVSRVFGPWLGISEDPATGSSHCALGPYWSAILGKTKMNAFQCFPGRGAQFNVSVDADKRRVKIIGSSVTVIKGEMTL